MVQALAYFPVSLYIPSYSKAIGLSTLDGTIALAIFNAARVVGEDSSSSFVSSVIMKLISLTLNSFRSSYIRPRLRQGGIYERDYFFGNRVCALRFPNVGLRP